ncbi:MAG TPA: HNH endonuclease [Dictyoglomaceae bacterium]|nr:HNH endonuclease [Dictyoglomaceae bacterium]HOP94711.1 HNH endonuclease [Dictyoglomaceae bacterium]HPP16702.1 HNH endonuclease [Dictyoglomaceae bacterium]HPP16728.1 HNH endonuclease [Dictyoglomaceae bacterium]HPU43060.1 HNH endonuclease [Dictyoglomaceae bacterium]
MEEDLLKEMVLVLNSNYEPLDVCKVKRAVSLIVQKKAETVETNTGVVRSASLKLEVPSVIRLLYYVKKPKLELRLSRKGILLRDNYTCQYCGKRGGDMTIDHVVPKRLGGKSVWENLVCACKECNHKKGDKTLEEANMKLIREPKAPKHVYYFRLTRYLEEEKNEGWRKYFFMDF